MKKIYRLIPVFLILAAFASCEQLDLTPRDKLSESDYFNTATELELFSNPLYNDLLDKSPFDEQSDVIVNAILNEIMIGGNRRTVPASGGGWSWGTLRRINTLLENVDRSDDQEAITKYSAVARFFRAYFYFDKVQRFGDVPWYDTQLFSTDEELYKPRDSREFVLSKM